MLGELLSHRQKWRQEFTSIVCWGQTIYYILYYILSAIYFLMFFSWHFKRRKYSSSLERITDTFFPLFQSFVFPFCFDPPCQNDLICLSGRRHHHTLSQVLQNFQNYTLLSQNLSDSKWHAIGYTGYILFLYILVILVIYTGYFYWYVLVCEQGALQIHWKWEQTKPHKSTMNRNKYIHLP